MTTITDDVIDSRTIQVRIEELEEIEYYTHTSSDELSFLFSFKDEIDECDKWDDGITFIHENHFTEYIGELLADCHPELLTQINNLPEWLCRHITIDWKGIADDMKPDYTVIEYKGHTYYYV